MHFWRRLAPTGILITGGLVAAAPAAGFTTTAYVADGSQYAITPLAVAADGTLAHGTLTPVFNKAQFPTAIAISPDGKSAYVATSQASGQVDEYDVLPGGELQHKTTALIAAGSYPQGIAISPDGRSVYATNHGDGTVSQYDVGAGGVLAAKSTATIIADTGATGIIVSPNGHNVYTANDTGNVSQFAVSASGMLGPIAGAPATVAAGSGISSIAITPDGRTVLVSGATTHKLFEYSVGANGALQPLTGAASVTTTVFGTSVTVSPDGRSVYVAGPDYALNNGTGDVWQGTLSPGGAVTAKTPATVTLTGGKYPLSAAVNPDGRNLYVTLSQSGSVAELAVGSGGLLGVQTTVANVAGAEPIALVPDEGPVAMFSATPAPAGRATSFDASASSAPSGAVTGYSWRFGDGTTAAGTTPTTTHVYASGGVYTATLTVFDDAGCSTALVFTGGTAYCNADPIATISHTVTVPSLPVLSALRVAPVTFHRSGRTVHGRCVPASRQNRARRPCARRLDLIISYRLSTAAQVTLTLERTLAGRSVAGRCLAVTRANRNRHVCTRLLAVPGAITTGAGAGASTFRLLGKFAGHTLASGRYRLTAAPAGGAAVSTHFRIAT